MWNIDKSFDFCYGHRVWDREGESPECRFLHGHKGTIQLSFESSHDVDVTLINNFINDYINNKFMFHINDPIFLQMLQLSIGECDDPNDERGQFLTRGMDIIYANPIKVDDTIFGYTFDLSEAGDVPLRDVFEGVTILNYNPTTINLVRWMFLVIKEHLQPKNINPPQVSWLIDSDPNSKVTFFEN